MITGKTIALTRLTFVGKVMSLLFNVLSRLVQAFLPRRKHLLISWLQSPSAVVLEPKKINSVTVSIVSPPICHEVMGLDAMVNSPAIQNNYISLHKHKSRPPPAPVLWQLGVVLSLSGLEWVPFYNSWSMLLGVRKDKFNGAHFPVHVNLISSLSYFHWGLRNRLSALLFLLLAYF